MATKLQEKQTELEKLQATVAQLVAERDERNQPVDPTKVNLESVRDHLAIRQQMLPSHDLSDLSKRADELGDSPNSDQTAAFLYALDRFLGKNGGVVHEFSYLRDVADEVHQAALDRKANQTPAFDEAEPAEYKDEDDEDEDVED